VSTPAPMVRIRLQLLGESGLRHPTMFGAFSHNQLAAAKMIDDTYMRISDADQNQRADQPTKKTRSV